MRSGTRIRGASRKRHTRRIVLVSYSVTMALLGATLGGMPSSVAGATAAVAALPAAKTFVYTGKEQKYTVPSSVTLLTVRAVGAFGGPALFQAGDGEDLTAYLPVTPKERLYTEVGQIGSVSGCTFHADTYSGSGTGTAGNGPTGGSGVISGCAAKIALGQPIYTSSVGRHTFIVRGTISGRAVKGVVTYTVIPPPTVKLTRASGRFQLPSP